MRAKCANCLAEVEQVFKVEGYFACEDCFIQSQLPWHLRTMSDQLSVSLSVDED